MAISKLSMSKSPLCRLALVAVAASLLLVSSCHASRQVPVPVVGSSKTVVIEDDPKCESVLSCQLDICTQYCHDIGLKSQGFCTYRNLQFYCCCPIA
ncbi:hypothetical protein GUJ93_ZPchr0006g46470 [Zizania palustris]|uniref:Knottin scorpion toxin-like domain-containing protein n=1 Tax=Zizania palustris TaxID=103762 RepID=A0A8J5VMY1_ZIZPA|nr:hypothetical protein GUJ93_ZPchr0006g46470 [Zizania palustris]